MNKNVRGAAASPGLLFGFSTTSFAAGDGLGRRAAATGNSSFAGQHREARSGSAMVRPRMRSGRMMRRHR
ncbi:hypothetical protein G3T14_07440 [Methylobacterium sp. BTF04]|uniref:hypothetical protein n=1 Tax=Methylobacterium sp. BTF04 TaxID=2708300 RepID=UPI0013D30853|nr:hypothetical protein [Methylobacterium sp. BTF04]NEU11962.1 hypothetical protein [Methylobacterium sp. BTF04]